MPEADTTDTSQELTPYQVWKQDPISQKALERIETLKAELIRLETVVQTAISHLNGETGRLRDAALAAHRVIDPKKAPPENPDTPS